MEMQARMDSLMSDQESEKVEIYFSIRGISSSKIFLDIYLQETDKPRKKLLQTKPVEVYNSNADFPQSLLVDYYFEIRQKIVVDVYSASSQKIGQCWASVGQIFNGRNKGVQKNIEKQGRAVGGLKFKGEKVEKGNNKFIQFSLSSRNIDVGSYFLCFGDGTCLWKLYKVKNNEDYLLYQSEAKEGKNNQFKTLKISQKKLCNSNPKQPIIFRFFKDAGQNTIGEVRTDLQTIRRGTVRYTLMKNRSQKGIMTLEGFKQTVKYDFTDYLSNGMQMAMVACIDFTASNGLPHHPSSLHFVSPHKRSQYQQALHEVSNIVLDYDTDKLVPLFGFGAKVNLPTFNTNGKVHHCFPLNGSSQNPNVFQLSGMLETYRSSLPNLSLAGPTLFAPLLSEAMKVCSAMKQQCKDYMILLIMTDGIIHDKDEVKNLLVKCATLPLSVIIIGIGNNQDWSTMRQLDDDNMEMRDENGNPSLRDLVQFVEFSKHNNNGVELAREVLEELPKQVQQYNNLVGLTPQNYRVHLNSDIIQQKGIQF